MSIRWIYDPKKKNIRAVQAAPGAGASSTADTTNTTPVAMIPPLAGGEDDPEKRRFLDLLRGPMASAIARALMEAKRRDVGE